MINEKEFVKLVKENERIIYKIISLYTDTEEDKKDLYQETLLQLWKSLNSYKGNSQFSTWMYRVSLNVALSFRRKSVKLNFESLENISHLKAEVENKEDFEILYVIIKHLNENDRMIITLHLDGYSNEEISEIVGISRNNTNVKIHRIKDMISKLYDSLKDGHQ